MVNIPVGLQLYTLREETADDFTGTLKQVADMGYRTVEFAGYGGMQAKDMKNVLDGLGLRAVSGHVGIDALESDPDREIDYLNELGADYIVCPWIDKANLLDETAFAELVALFRRIGGAAKKAGLVFCYHNHEFEFAKSGGAYILDRLYDAVEPDRMQAELDLYWVKKGGLDPRKYMLQYTGRVPIVHVKDMAGDEEGSFAEVGRGIIDYPAIFEAAGSAGVRHFIVEQDACKRPPLESVKMSIDYLKSIGIA